MEHYNIENFVLENYHPLPVSMNVYVVRKIIIETMKEIYLDFNLHPQTFFIAISIFDKGVEKDWKIFLRKNYKFIATSLLWISSKFEEIHPLCFDDLLYIVEYEESKEKFLEFEKTILEKIEYQIPRITSYCILDQYKKKYSILNEKDIFNRCLEILTRKTMENNVSSLSVLEIIHLEIK